MKKSEELELLAAQSENDLIAFAIYQKSDRELRMETFMGVTMPQLNQKGIVTPYDDVRACFNIRHPDGKEYDFYPKSNRIHFRKQNAWLNNGISFINKFIKQDDK